MTIKKRTYAGLAPGLLLLALLTGPATAQAQADCVTTRVQGQPVVFARGAERITLEPGIGLGRGGTVRTGADERVTLTCSGGLTVVVGPQTELSVSGILDGGTRPFGLRLLDGIAGFLLDDGNSGGVQVTTPSAVAAVRSTQWAVRVDEKASAIFAREGTVFAFGDSDTAARLQAGDGIDISATGEARPIVQWGQKRIDLFASLLGDDW